MATARAREARTYAGVAERALARAATSPTADKEYAYAACDRQHAASPYDLDAARRDLAEVRKPAPLVPHFSHLSRVDS